MKRLERLLAALTPKRWPVRWRLAAVSAALTLIILVMFAVVVGRLASNRLQTSFDNELRDNAARLAAQINIAQNPFTGELRCPLRGDATALARERRNSRGHSGYSRLRERAAWDPAPRATAARHDR